MLLLPRVLLLLSLTTGLSCTASVLLRNPLVSRPLENSSRLVFMLAALLFEAESLVVLNLLVTGRDIWLMLMLVARNLEGGVRTGGGG